MDRLGDLLRFAFRQPRIAVARHRRLLRPRRHPHHHQPHRFRSESNYETAFQRIFYIFMFIFSAFLLEYFFVVFATF